MKILSRFIVASGLMFLALNLNPLYAQENMPVDLSGTWFEWYMALDRP
jgi:hypothetical protein